MFYRDSIEFLEPMTNSLQDYKEVTMKLHEDMTGMCQCSVTVFSCNFLLFVYHLNQNVQLMFKMVSAHTTCSQSVSHILYLLVSSKTASLEYIFKILEG